MDTPGKLILLSPLNLTEHLAHRSRILSNEDRQWDNALFLTQEHSITHDGVEKFCASAQSSCLLKKFAEVLKLELKQLRGINLEISWMRS